MTENPVAPPPTWTGQVDGTTQEHLRWHQAVTPLRDESHSCACVFIGFASDEGVARNKGRRGAAAGPDALRNALSSMAVAEPIRACDAGTIVVADDQLEAGQEALGATVAAALDAGQFPLVFGGGQEVAYGTYLGLAQSSARSPHLRIGVLNLDAHFDLRADPVANSGTPFRQMIERERAAGTSLQYSVLGISQPSNTTALFEAAHSLDARYLLDDDCSVTDRHRVAVFVSNFLSDADLVYLSIDLDVLPASVAPGVSAPAAYGVPLETIQFVCDAIAASGKLAVCDVAELNPAFDVDNRTARTAARLIHRIVTKRIPPPVLGSLPARSAARGLK
ncbi:formimidoylglutamase [Rhodococcus sp. WMMA185]|uniref:formimidoylglutamase n=1 Tax=Rhodococcus sp. WMMA185 TaxID=679318 RepID=UPI000878F11F|nr:formimidoylglutamase [Rhodococcus sp. WMMA185]AOW93499.1 formimidoylglutamase [Rhodococcus sp. WMMA185]